MSNFTFLKPFIPMVKKHLEGGIIDSQLQEMKAAYKDRLTHGGTVEVMITTEKVSGKDIEVASIVELADNQIYLLEQKKLTDLLTNLLQEL